MSLLLDVVGLGGLGLVAAVIMSADSDEKKLKQEMQSWSIAKLHAFAGMKHKHPAAIRTYAYNLAKEKKFNRS